jgi:hypothetical protein
MKQHINRLINFKRKGYDDPIDGIVVDYNNEYTLINTVDSNIHLDGYAVVSNESISSYKVYHDKDFLKKALKVQGLKCQKIKGVDLSNWVNVIKSVNNLYPLVALHRELIDNTICFIGSLAKCTEKTVSLKLINSSSEIEREKRFNLKDITKVEFGGNYERCLWLLADKKTKTYLKYKLA